MFMCSQHTAKHVSASRFLLFELSVMMSLLRVCVFLLVPWAAVSVEEVKRVEFTLDSKEDCPVGLVPLGPNEVVYVTWRGNYLQKCRVKIGGEGNRLAAHEICITPHNFRIPSTECETMVKLYRGNNLEPSAVYSCNSQMQPVCYLGELVDVQFEVQLQDTPVDDVDIIRDKGLVRLSFTLNELAAEEKDLVLPDTAIVGIFLAFLAVVIIVVFVVLCIIKSRN
ncbi:hypothetical protein ScPMuIL_008721 [Solemya velum]